ncbi:molybdenum cofactor guanylyltransferase [Rhodanobacter thiooxydans]|uniref:Molybdenum cofactor guanylyltransferase n=1 Tax=Rhodanobacter thiooxydans TaxID=416169 RepID=A0A154QND8_9GAMM|nr:molybdenum cofactor guanylyltransferase [Rhodanobacter thiooxydans]EIM02911.1 molybdopterin guanine dinucleotide synthase [Rhodanobacter thiooxydans LCS2]KZC25358.1 molybdenum cofactor guanylyltransferase [Rhodanobacter thiooxydans]MCW0203160.1 molybdenum cofactor guanylyltransferase [Rhodanobacter thiooxydans]
MTATRTAEPAPTFDGVVLAGGQSSRMGTDKATLPWRGRPLLQHMRGLLEQAGAQRVLTCGPDPEAQGLPDRQPGLGPVGGLLTLAQTQADGIYLVLPVDMPQLTNGLLRRLVGALAEAEETPCATFAGHVLPLCLRLDETTRAAIAAVAGQAPRMRSLRALHARLQGAELAVDDDERRCLVNCNTPEQWQEVQP